MKTILIALGVLVAVALIVHFFVIGPLTARIADSALGKIGALFDTKTGDMLVQGRQISERLQQADTRTTTRDQAIREQLDALRRDNRALRDELSRISGEVSSVATSVSDISISHGDTVLVGPGDFTQTFEDPWVKAVVERRESQLRFQYETTFRLEEFDIEITLPDGTKTHLFNAALISNTTGDTLQVPTTRSVIERGVSTGSRFHFLPQLHLRSAGGLGSAWVGLGVSTLTWGSGRYIETTKFFLLEGTVLFDGDGISVAVVPVSWNIGRALPLVRNLSIGVGWSWSEHQSGVIGVIGAAL
jgi:hypothetical protein